MKKGIFYSLLVFLLAITFLKLSSNSKAAFDNMPKVGLPYSIIEIGPDGSRKETKGISSSESADAILSDLQIEKFESDRIQAFPELAMQIGSQITVNRAPVIFVKDGKRSATYRSWQKTVGELFAERKIEIGKDDKVNFADDIELENNVQIIITRVAITQVQEKKPIDYKTVKKDDPTLDEGKTKVAQAGIKGEKILTYLVKREDGDEVSRRLLGTEISKETTDEILMIGTKPVITVRCKYNDTVIEAAVKYGVSANAICTLMMKESNGNIASVSSGGHLGLFQYTEGFWADASKKAGFAGADWQNARAQIFTTAWAWSHGYRSRWP